MGEGVVEHRVIQAALMMRGSEPQERRLSADGLEDGHVVPVTGGHCPAPRLLTSIVVPSVSIPLGLPARAVWRR
jgi:hypothetical protein